MICVNIIMCEYHYDFSGEYHYEKQQFKYDQQQIKKYLKAMEIGHAFPTPQIARQAGSCHYGFSVTRI